MSILNSVWINCRTLRCNIRVNMPSVRKTLSFQCISFYIFIFIFLWYTIVKLYYNWETTFVWYEMYFFILACQRFVWFLWVTANFMSLVLWFIYISFALNDNILTIKQLFVWLFSNEPNKLTTIKSFFYHVYQTEGHYWFESLKS